MALKTVRIKSATDIAAMRAVGKLAADTLQQVGALIRPGITTAEIDDFVVADTRAKGAIAAPLNYSAGGGHPPFPRSVCTSVNEVVCHGIPTNRTLQSGDIVNVDVTHIFGGYHGDTSATFYVGEPSKGARHVTEVARKCLALGIAEVGPGARLGDIGAAIQEFAEAQGCSVVREYSGHGIGTGFHEPPTVLHYGRRGKGRRVKTGMTFTVEPMINLGAPGVHLLDDGWTVETQDGSLSAQFEHTVLVTPSGCDILTARERPLENSEGTPYDFDAARSALAAD